MEVSLQQELFYFPYFRDDKSFTLCKFRKSKREFLTLKLNANLKPVSTEWANRDAVNSN